MIKIEKDMEVKVYNDGILLFMENSVEEIKELIGSVLKTTVDTWEVELLNNILYTINNNLSTMEVA